MPFLEFLKLFKKKSKMLRQTYRKNTKIDTSPSNGAKNLIGPPVHVGIVVDEGHFSQGRD